jgi:hypothetical protein
MDHDSNLTGLGFSLRQHLDLLLELEDLGREGGREEGREGGRESELSFLLYF